jgi:hypothetical protein
MGLARTKADEVASDGPRIRDVVQHIRHGKMVRKAEIRRNLDEAFIGELRINVDADNEDFTSVHAV